MCDWLINITCNDISVIYLTAHRCAGGLKKKFDLRSIFQPQRHFVGFFNVLVQSPTRDRPFLRLRPIYSPFTTRWGYGGYILDLTPRVRTGPICSRNNKYIGHKNLLFANFTDVATRIKNSNLAISLTTLN